MGQCIIDAHQHFWEPEKLKNPWLDHPKRKRINRTFLPEDLKQTIAQVGVERTVLVQTLSNLEDTRWFLELVEANDFIAGVVGWVDLTDPRLKGLDEFLKHPKFKGIRHHVENEPDPDWLVRDDVMAGLSELSRRNLPYDLLITTRHLKHVPVIARMLPELKMVVNHMAKPPISTGRIDEWAREMEPLSQFPQVYCKLSGLITEADWTTWKNKDLKPYVRHAVKVFGCERLMFGSDWPVCLLAGSYQQVWDSFNEILRFLSDEERAMIFGENARKFYSLRMD